jgi:hypothetical protein
MLVDRDAAFAESMRSLSAERHHESLDPLKILKLHEVQVIYLNVALKA